MNEIPINQKILEMIDSPKGTKYFKEIQKEMLKIVNELHWHDDDDGLLLKDFINDFFSQFEPYLTYNDEEILNWRSGNSLD
jgi:hypothetical protein